jgi:beta-glucosidase
MRHYLNSAVASLVIAFASGCGSAQDSAASDIQSSDKNISAQATPIYKDPSQPIAARVNDLMGRMSLDEKLGQMTQADRGWAGPINPGDVTELRLGSMLSGGDSGPETNTPSNWADMYDTYQKAALATPLAIPLIYGVDAVHGHANVIGATVFPHNIGLGSTRDPELVERIGKATAKEIAATGIDWTFSPCIAVTRDDHWGRVYESFGEVPELPSTMTSLITGLQGSTLGGATSVLATAKHYVGDGGTLGGDDQGNTVVTEAELRAMHLPPFQEAIKRNVGAIMASYSSWNGAKMHNHKYLITDVLKGELGFAGFVMTDWDGIELLDGQYGFSSEDVRSSVNAGVDMFMITQQYRNFIQLLRTEVQAGRVAMSRIDDANRRILTKKFELGLFERPLADRSLLGSIGSAEHRKIAREAVQKSQVVLKNQNGILPLSRSSSKLFVAGKTAENIGYQSGGWTVKWQGGSGPITPGTSILQGIKNTLASSATVTYDKDAAGIDSSYTAAIAVIGETPYAEYEGDRTDELKLDSTDVAVLAKLKASGVPVVVVLVSGRPLDISEHVGSWAGLVASWLPGTEGQGVADILFGVVAPSGKLPLTWMQNATQQPINVGDGKTPLFAFGHGLTYPAVPSEPEPELPGRNPRDTIRAESYTGQVGTELEGCSESGCGQSLGYINPGDYLYYDNIDFGTSSPSTVSVRVASGASSGDIEFRLDAIDGPLVAKVGITPTGGWTSWTTKSASLVGTATGKHRLYVVFKGPGGDFVNLNWFRFS